MTLFNLQALRRESSKLMSMDMESITRRGGTIHRCIDISRYFSRDTYRNIIFYNQNFFLLLFFFSTMIFI